MAGWIKLMKDQETNYEHNLDYLLKYRKTKDEAALEWLVLNNANLVHKIVGGYRSFYNHKLSYDDLFSVGLEGLLRAIEKFDFNFENNFATYATYWIKQSVVRLITDEGFMIKIPTHLFETLQQVIKCEMNYEDTPLAKEELCEKLSITTEKYELIAQVRNHMLKWTSINKPVSLTDETEIGDLLSSESGIINLSTESRDTALKSVENAELKNAISKSLTALDAREKLIIIHRFGLFGTSCKTLAEIGKKEGISRERIRQLETRAIRKLKRFMKGYESYLSN